MDQEDALLLLDGQRRQTRPYAWPMGCVKEPHCLTARPASTYLIVAVSLASATAQETARPASATAAVALEKTGPIEAEADLTASLAVHKVLCKAFVQLEAASLAVSTPRSSGVLKPNMRVMAMGARSRVDWMVVGSGTGMVDQAVSTYVSAHETKA